MTSSFSCVVGLVSVAAIAGAAHGGLRRSYVDADQVARAAWSIDAATVAGWTAPADPLFGAGGATAPLTVDDLLLDVDAGASAPQDDGAPDGGDVVGLLTSSASAGGESMTFEGLLLAGTTELVSQGDLSFDWSGETEPVPVQAPGGGSPSDGEQPQGGFGFGGGDTGSFGWGNNWMGGMHGGGAGGPPELVPLPAAAALGLAGLAAVILWRRRMIGS